MPQPTALLGIHHITAIAGDPQTNVEFYVGLLGLRLVKRTVNFDDPTTYHLYYGDAAGHPGTVLTFFPWKGLPRGRPGTGQATATAFSVPESSLGFWTDRLRAAGVETEGPAPRLGEQALTFHDPDGLRLELVAQTEAPEIEPWPESPVPARHALRGFHSATLSLEGYEATATLLADTMGFRPIAEEGNRFRFAAAGTGLASRLDLLCQPDGLRGTVAVGSIHHIAFRVASDEVQQEWRQTLVRAGRNVTPVLNRQYFRSIYFREPGGVLFEIATDSPGFGVDESPDDLGTHLKLPPWLEPHRPRIEAALPEIHPPPPPAARPRRG